jgi:hypothetical protein
MNMPMPAVLAMLNEVAPPSRVLSHCVPTRIIRVVDAYGDDRTYRVEQLVQQGGAGAYWRALSTHSNKEPCGAAKVAHQAAWVEQKKLIAKIQQVQKNAQQSMHVLDARNQVTPVLKS